MVRKSDARAARRAAAERVCSRRPRWRLPARRARARRCSPRALLRPLGVLGQAARRLGEGDLAARARVDGQATRSRALAGEFNTMAERLQQYRESSLGELLAGAAARRRRRSTACPIRSSCSASTGELLHAEPRGRGAARACAPQTRPRRASTRRCARCSSGCARTCSAASGAYVPQGARGGRARREPPTASGGSCRAATPVYSEQGDGDRQRRSCCRT